MSERIRSRLAEIIDEAAELRDEVTALSELEELDEDQQARFDELIGDDSPIHELAAERGKAEGRLKVLDTYNAAAARGQEAVEVGEDRSVQFMKQTETAVDPLTASRAEVRDAARKVLETEHKTQAVPLSDVNAAHIEKLVNKRSNNFDGDYLARRLLITETPEYRSGWAKALTQPVPAFSPEEANALNQFRVAEQSLTSASGGYGVPVIIDPTILLTSGGASAPLLNVSRVEFITNDVWRGVSSAGVAFSASAESAEISASQATLAQPTVTPEKGTAFIPYTFEIEGDYPNLAGEMSNLLEVAYIDYVGEQTAVGAAGMVGIFTAIDATASQEVNPTTDGALGPEDALVVWNALTERPRSRASWFMDVTVESQLRTGADGYGTRSLSSEGIGPLLGKQVLLSDYAPAFTGTTGASNLAILGDFNSFVIAQRVGMNIELVPHVFTSNGLPDGTRGWLAWARIGSDAVVDEDFVLLQNA
jgi:HK97 family phage major capsid protein